ncbi:MAG: R3H domain-containing nucleic acid-binding protein [Thermoanaerobaculia bacterium]
MKSRRYFWGNTLPQALMSAARYHAIPPDELAYRIYDKRHGFVTRTRRLILEVDPAAPQRVRRDAGASPKSEPVRPVALPSAISKDSATSAAPATPSRPSAPTPDIAVSSAPSPENRPANVPRNAPASRSAGRPPSTGAPDPFVAPDEEAALAASEAMARLLTFAGLKLEIHVELQPERLLISLSGEDEERLRVEGEIFLDDLEQLVPRVIRGLAGRMVRCKVNGAGLRDAREEELRKLAQTAADEVAKTGQPTLLDPLSAADRRIVHLSLVDDPRVSTESEGFGVEKRVRISPAAAPVS